MKIKMLFALLILALLFIGCTQQTSDTNNQTQNITNTNTPTAVPPTSQYTKSEVSTHSTASDCWMILNNKVYDFTKYISSHPGGNKMIVVCGKDGISMFNATPHSAFASMLTKDYEIGVLK